MAVNKILKIDGANISWTCKQIAKMVEKETLSFRNVVQRSFCWEKKRMSDLIWSIIMGFPVPSIYAERKNEDNEKIKIYDVLDGQQRCTTIYKYLNDEFALTELKPILYLDENENECELNISGKKFSELDEELQDTIKDATITVKYFDNLDQQNKAEMFRRLNNGKPLSTKSRLLASCKDIEGILNIGSHKLFGEMLTEKSRENKNQVALTMKVWCMMFNYSHELSFESKHFYPLIEETEISDAEKIAMSSVFDLIIDTHTALINMKKKNIAKKLYTETHFVSLIPYFWKAVDNDINCNLMVDWISDFFDSNDNASVSDQYNDACASGSAKSANIIARNDALANSFSDFFKLDKENNIENSVVDQVEGNSYTNDEYDNDDEISNNLKEVSDTLARYAELLGEDNSEADTSGND